MDPIFNETEANWEDHSQPPAGSQIRKEQLAGDTTLWRIPASNRSGGLLFFAIAWNAISWAVWGMFLFSWARGAVHGGSPILGLLFSSLFPLIGVGLFYGAARAKWARHDVAVTPETVGLRRELFGRATVHTLPRSEVLAVEERQFYSQNYQPVYGVEIRTDSGKKLRFGSTLTKEEKAWLTADLRFAILGGQQEEPIPPIARQSQFSIPLPPRVVAPWMVILVLLVVGSVLASVPWWGLKKANHGGFDFHDDLLGAAVEFLKHQPQTAVGAVLLLVGLALLLRRLLVAGCSDRLEGTESEVSIVTYRGDRAGRRRTFARDSIEGVEVASSGESNGVPRKRLDLLVSGRKENLRFWMDGVTADHLMHQIRSVLG